MTSPSELMAVALECVVEFEDHEVVGLLTGKHLRVVCRTPRQVRQEATTSAGDYMRDPLPEDLEKVIRAVATIAAGGQDLLYLGKLDAKWDWGWQPTVLFSELVLRIFDHDLSGLGLTLDEARACVTERFDDDRRIEPDTHAELYSVISPTGCWALRTRAEGALIQYLAEAYVKGVSTP